MRTAGIIIAAWLALDLTLVAIFAAFGAWRTHQTRERARAFLAEDRLAMLRDPLESVWAMPTFDPERWHA